MTAHLCLNETILTNSDMMSVTNYFGKLPRVRESKTINKYQIYYKDFDKSQPRISYEIPDSVHLERFNYHYITSLKKIHF